MTCPQCLREVPPWATRCPTCHYELGAFPELKPGDVLSGRFRLARLIGRGGAGVIWLAEDTQLNNDLVACKLLRGDLFHDRRALADMKREVLLARKLRHPHILAVYTFYETDTERFITMEFVEGQSLAEALAKRDAPFSLEEALPWARQLSEALDYAHDQGVLHRDIKTGNILLGQDGAVRLADFGIARTAEEVRSRLTGRMTGGTVMYMSPEQLTSDEMDRRSDLYSLAVALYELLSGAPPFFKGVVVTQIQFDPPPPIESVSDAVNHVLMKALAKRPQDRYPSCGIFYTELADAVQGASLPETGRPAAAGLPERPASPRLFDPEEETIKLPLYDNTGKRKRLGAILVAAGLITVDQLEEALTSQRGMVDKLGAVLVGLGYADSEAIARALESQLQIPFVSLGNETFDPEVAGLIPRCVAERLRCIPMRREGDQVVAAVADPLDLDALNELEFLCRARATLRIALESDITWAIARVYGP